MVRPVSRASEVKAASSSPQAVIQSVKGAGSRSTFSAYPCVVTQRLMCTPIEASFLGGRSSHTPGEPLDPRRLDLERGGGADDRLLEVPAVELDVAAVAVEVENRIADELARPVIGGLPPAVCLDELDLDAVRDVDLARLRAAAERHRRRVLDEDDRVRDRTSRDGRGERALQLPRLGVVGRAEVHEVGAEGHCPTLPSVSAPLPRLQRSIEARMADRDGEHRL